MMKMQRVYSNEEPFGLRFMEKADRKAHRGAEIAKWLVVSLAFECLSY